MLPPVTAAPVVPKPANLAATAETIVGTADKKFSAPISRARLATPKGFLTNNSPVIAICLGNEASLYAGLSVKLSYFWVNLFLPKVSSIAFASMPYSAMLRCLSKICLSKRANCSSLVPLDKLRAPCLSTMLRIFSSSAISFNVLLCLKRVTVLPSAEKNGLSCFTSGALMSTPLSNPIGDITVLYKTSAIPVRRLVASGVAPSTSGKLAVMPFPGVGAGASSTGGTTGAAGAADPPK